MSKDLAQRDRSTDLGVVRINNEAIMTIAAAAAMEVCGVHRLGGGIGTTFREAVFCRTCSKGVRIRMREGDVKLSVSIVVEYGANIPRIGDEVQDNVKRAVEKMTGLVLSAVDVVVEGVFAKITNEKERKA
ncbi:MAG: Asp23/Gls24 family envelope stress response protein [Candidatus Omnitrophota bacterium]